MARNEEKQLARLNRFYLQKQREEDLKKRPPRPKLESLTTPEELRKWLPTITRDIEFYVKQMEVTCYRDQHIEEFNRRISHHRGEYKAFLRKLRELEPSNKMTPWTDRPYKVKKHSNFKDICSDPGGSDSNKMEEKSTQSPVKFTPLQTPVLNDDQQNALNFGYEKHVVADCPDLSHEGMNQPLQFSSTSTSKSKRYSNNTHRATMFNAKAGLATANETRNLVQSPNKECVKERTTSTSDNGVDSCSNSGRNIEPQKIVGGLLNIPYSDSSSSCDDSES